MSKFGEIRYDPDVEAWLGSVELSGFESCGILWDCDEDSFSEAYEKSEPTNGPVLLEIQINSIEGKPPTKEQEAAFEYLNANQNSIAQAILEYAFEQCQYVYYDESLPQLEMLTGEKRELRKRFDTLIGFYELVKPIAVNILAESENGISYVALDFVTALDEEHGFSILTYCSQSIGWGGIGAQGGGAPLIKVTDEFDPFPNWIECEEKYLELASKLTDLASIEKFTNDLVILEAESFLNQNRFGLELYNRPKLNKQLSNIMVKRITEFERIKKTSLDAFEKIERIRNEAVIEPSEILNREHQQRIAGN